MVRLSKFTHFNCIILYIYKHLFCFISIKTWEMFSITIFQFSYQFQLFNKSVKIPFQLVAHNIHTINAFNFQKCRLELYFKSLRLVLVYKYCIDTNLRPTILKAKKKLNSNFKRIDQVNIIRQVTIKVLFDIMQHAMHTRR